MTSREPILQRMRDALSKMALIAAPAPPEVWPRENPSTDAMAERFAAELTAVSGEFIRCASAHEARRRLAELASTAGWTSVGAMDRPAVRGP